MTFAITRELLKLRAHVKYCKKVFFTARLWSVGDEFVRLFVTSNRGKTKKAE